MRPAIGSECSELVRAVGSRGVAYAIVSSKLNLLAPAHAYTMYELIA